VFGLSSLLYRYIDASAAMTKWQRVDGRKVSVLRCLIDSYVNSYHADVHSLLFLHPIKIFYFYLIQHQLSLHREYVST
jgi:hypothetical protein